MTFLISFFQAFWGLLKTLLSWVLDGSLYVLKAGVYFIYDGLLTAVVAIVGALDVGTITASIAGAWAGLSPQLLYVVNETGIPSGLSIVFYAILIRMALNLIPAALTRI